MNHPQASPARSLSTVVFILAALSPVTSAAPSLVTALMVTGTSSSQTTLRWNASTDVGGPGLAGYEIYRNGALMGTTTATTFFDTTVAPSTLYCYTIVAYDTAGNNASPSAESCITTPASPSLPTAPGLYVDYSAGLDSNPGTNAAAPWQHCPGDPLATGNAASARIGPGTNIYFKGGVAYVLGNTSCGGTVCAGIDLPTNSSGSQAPIVLDGNTAGNWGVGPAIITDYGANQWHAGFYANGTDVSNVVIRGFTFTGIGGVGTNPLPPDTGSELAFSGGFGIFVNGGKLVNSTIASCVFTNIGYWQNVKPSGTTAIAGNSISPAGIEIDAGGMVGCTVTGNTFTAVHTGLDIAYEYAVTNNVIAGNTFAGYEAWGMHIATLGNNSVKDYNYVTNNLFLDIGGAYSQAYYTAYESSNPPHQDAIFDVSSVGNFSNGTNNDYAFNVFEMRNWASAAESADIFLEGGTSANIYNNLFNTPLVGGDGAVFVYEDNNNGTNFNIRILNNTFVVNMTNNQIREAWYVKVDSNAAPYIAPWVWPSTCKLQVENNLLYSFATSGVYGVTLVQLQGITNTFPVSSWTVDYNNDHSQQGTSPDEWFEFNNGGDGAGTTEYGGLALFQSFGLDTHGFTNDPRFVSLAYGATTNSPLNNYALQAGSPCIGAGVNLSSLNLPGLNVGINGAPRPATGNWDIGAYQH
ncbi:MAG: choice-of-anchor Q domain-containing protein [Verrucomicrobiia bacterium]